MHSTISYVLFSWLLTSANSLNNGDSYEVIVIGGGIAGVKAAVDLVKQGKKVLLLQANDYLGGRMQTIDVSLQTGSQFKFDQGASWIHGNTSDHPITQLASDVSGLKSADTDDDSLKVYTQAGSLVTQTSQDTSTLYTKYQEKFSDQKSTVSVRSAISNQNSSSLTDSIFMFNIANNIEFQTSGTIDVLSAAGYNDGSFDGTQRLILSGYQQFVTTLSSKATFDVELNRKVSKVAWDNSKKASLVTVESGLTVYGTNIVIAVPLGVLKAGTIIFEPALPSQKTAAISSIGFGNVVKILLDFSASDFFTQTQHYIGVASSDVTKRGLATYFLNLKALAGVPALMTFGLGVNSDEAESMSDSDLKALLVTRLNVFTARTVTASDFNMYRTSWRSKTNFQGTYSYASTSTTSSHWDEIERPVYQHNWFFCGQHTYKKYRGTVHGAFLSGERAAKHILVYKGLVIGMCVMAGVLLVGFMLVFFSVRYHWCESTTYTNQVQHISNMSHDDISRAELQNES